MRHHSTRMPHEFGGRSGTEMSEWERSVLILGSQISSAYPAMCEIQREAKIYKHLICNTSKIN